MVKASKGEGISLAIIVVAAVIAVAVGHTNGLSNQPANNKPVAVECTAPLEDCQQVKYAND